MPLATDHQEAIVFDIQRGSMVDGPGIRTAVFLKGCPLRCAWCHNPESMRREPQTVITARGESKTYGKRMSLDRVWDAIEKDIPFYQSSGGGMTISGGEPMYSFEFTAALAERAKVANVHVAIDTTGYGTLAQWNRLLPFVDLLLLDYKMTNAELHLKYTGIPAATLHENIRYLSAQGVRIRLRCPIIPGINDTEDHFEGIVQVAGSINNLDGVDLMPYHNTGRYKYDELQLPYSIQVESSQLSQKEQWQAAVFPKLMQYPVN